MVTHRTALKMPAGPFCLLRFIRSKEGGLNSLDAPIRPGDCTGREKSKCGDEPPTPSSLPATVRIARPPSRKLSAVGRRFSFSTKVPAFTHSNERNQLDFFSPGAAISPEK